MTEKKIWSSKVRTKVGQLIKLKHFQNNNSTWHVQHANYVRKNVKLNVFVINCYKETRSTGWFNQVTIAYEAWRQTFSAPKMIYRAGLFENCWSYVSGRFLVIRIKVQKDAFWFLIQLTSADCTSPVSPFCIHSWLAYEYLDLIYQDRENHLIEWNVHQSDLHLKCAVNGEYYKVR